ncbi:hypothetical protein ABS768_04440 [Flavobacterium sp. ST-75]|uniref:Response regulatory domain-containing protein n=1 Tax=Flavobacterium rhizophilum TaxID=3163296 RepID=A0ABW8Y9U4_9FLAO
MNEMKPIVLIDDDVDDIDLLVEAYHTLSYTNKLLIFHDSVKAYDYFTENGILPFLVISDVLMPKMTGLELHEKLLAFPGFKEHYIPFVFFSGAPVPPPSVSNNSLIMHCYFEKKCDFEELRLTLDSIISHYFALSLK